MTIPVIPPKPPPPGEHKSVVKPSAFSSPGSMGKGWAPAKGVRFRSLKVTRGPGRPRKKARDKRDVLYY
jgi:hypothetical protein